MTQKQKIEKSLMEEIKEFLVYLAKNHRDIKKREQKLLYSLFGENIYHLCLERNYINSEKLEKKKIAGRINTEGLYYLEKIENQKIQKEQIDAQNFLTWGILSFAIFSGVLIMIYYYFDLKNRGFDFDSKIFAGAGVVLLILIVAGIIKLGPKKKKWQK